MQFHRPVLTNTVIAHLQPGENKRYIDATLGGGGHAQALLAAGASVLGIDQDPEAIAYVKNRSDLDHSRLTLVEDNFVNLSSIATRCQWTAVDGIVFDLGTSSHQFDTVHRGFSFQSQAPLDMRMSPHLAVTAKDLVNGLGKRELYELFTKYAQERFARQIAAALVLARRLKPIDTTSELANIITKVYQSKGQRGKIHPATRVFQALRIAVNDELNNLKVALPQALELLKPGGTLAVISFHEGEDRLVKQFFRQTAGEGKGEIRTKKPLTPESEEIKTNPRARSAKLRAFKKL